MKSKEFFKELQNKNIKQLSENLAKNRVKLVELRKDLEMGKTGNYREIRTARQHIAQTLTVLNQKAEEAIQEDGKSSKE